MIKSIGKFHVTQKLARVFHSIFRGTQTLFKPYFPPETQSSNGALNIFYVHPYLGEDSHFDLHIFKGVWNHQLENNLDVFFCHLCAFSTMEKIPHLMKSSCGLRKMLFSSMTFSDQLFHRYMGFSHHPKGTRSPPKHWDQRLSPRKIKHWRLIRRRRRR